MTSNSEINNTINKIQNEDDPIKVFIKGTNNISSKQSLLILPIIKYFNDPINLNYLIQILNGETFGTNKQESNSPISLRLIDWFVTNYCKKKNIMYNLNNYKNKSVNNASGTSPDNFDNYFFVHDNYKSQLKECSKKHFDPFCRRNRIRFYYEPHKYFITTVGQLNFFKWALENHVIDFIRDHLADIEQDMNQGMAQTIAIKPDKNTEKLTKKKQPNATSINTNTSSNTTIVSNNSNVTINSVQTILSELMPKTKTHKKNTTRQKRKELSSSANKSFTNHSIPSILTFD